MASIRINNEEVICESYEATSTSLTIIGMVTEDGTINLTLNGVNWDNVILPESTEPEPTIEERISAIEDLLLEML